MAWLESWLIVLPVCAALGYALGAVRLGHFALGGSAVLFVGMALGAAGAELPSAIRELGLVLFIYAVGTETRGFRAAMTSRGPRLIVTCAATVGAGFATALFCGWCFGLPTAGVAGLFGGALTSTPALATALDGLDPARAALLTTAYGLAYPAGIIGVVVFVQAVGRLDRVDLAADKAGPVAPAEETARDRDEAGPHLVHPVPVLAVIGAGCALGQIPVPLPGQTSVSLGSAGGVLLCAILAANQRKFALTPAPGLRLFLREWGLYAFLAGVGTQTGNILDLETLRGGVSMLAGGVLTVSIPLAVCWLLGRRVFGIDFLSMLGAVAGSMTSTPGLAAATSVSSHRIVVQSYATVYPVALLAMIVLIKVLFVFLASG